MEIKDLLRLLLPLATMILGFIIKKSNNDNFLAVKKYWLFFVIVGALLFFVRLYKYIK